MEHWTTAQMCCSSWKWLEEGNWGEPKVQAACSAKEFQSAGFSEAPHSECSRPESACSDGSSFDGPRLLSCTSTESERKREAGEARTGQTLSSSSQQVQNENTYSLRHPSVSALRKAKSSIMQISVSLPATNIETKLGMMLNSDWNWKSFPISGKEVRMTGSSRPEYGSQWKRNHTNCK